MLDRLDEGLWTATRPMKAFGLTLASRMTVARLRDGGLWVHSPVRLAPTLRAEFDRLGPVSGTSSP